MDPNDGDLRFARFVFLNVVWIEHIATHWKSHLAGVRVDVSGGLEIGHGDVKWDDSRSDMAYGNRV